MAPPQRFALTFHDQALGVTIAPTFDRRVVVRGVKPGCPHFAALQPGDELRAVAGDASVLAAAGDATGFQRLADALRTTPRSGR